MAGGREGEGGEWRGEGGGDGEEERQGGGEGEEERQGGGEGEKGGAACRLNQTQSDAIRRNQAQSGAVRRNQTQSDAITHLRVDGSAVDLLADASREFAELVRVEIVRGLAGDHDGGGADGHAAHVGGIDHLLSITHAPHGLDLLGARRVVLTAEPSLRLAHILRLAHVPVGKGRAPW